jgi:hypothetical protein
MNDTAERYYGQGAAALAAAIVSGGKRGDTPHATRQAAAGIIALSAGSPAPIAAVSMRALIDDAATRGGVMIPYAVHVAGGSIPDHRLCIACSAQYCDDAAQLGVIDPAPAYWELGAPLGCSSCGEYYGHDAHCDTCRCNVEGGRS